MDAFPLISAGIFGYPKDKAWGNCGDFFQKNLAPGFQVLLAVLDNSILVLGQQTLDEIAPSRCTERHTRRGINAGEIVRTASKRWCTDDLFGDE